MEESSPFYCRIFVNEKEIYSGDLGEVPERFRAGMILDLTEWAGSLGKRGLNELIYSHLAWYEEKALYCENCGAEEKDDRQTVCGRCSQKLVERYIYDRNGKLDMIITCVGMISSVEFREAG